MSGKDGEGKVGHSPAPTSKPSLANARVKTVLDASVFPGSPGGRSFADRKNAGEVRFLVVLCRDSHIFGRMLLSTYDTHIYDV